MTQDWIQADNNNKDWSHFVVVAVLAATFEQDQSKRRRTKIDSLWPILRPTMQTCEEHDIRIPGWMPSKESHALHPFELSAD